MRNYSAVNLASQFINRCSKRPLGSLFNLVRKTAHRRNVVTILHGGCVGFADIHKPLPYPIAIGMNDCDVTVFPLAPPQIAEVSWILILAGRTEHLKQTLFSLTGLIVLPSCNC